MADNMPYLYSVIKNTQKNKQKLYFKHTVHESSKRAINMHRIKI